MARSDGAMQGRNGRSFLPCSCRQVKLGVQVNQKVLVVKKIGKKKDDFQLSATADKPKLA